MLHKNEQITNLDHNTLNLSWLILKLSLILQRLLIIILIVLYNFVIFLSVISRDKLKLSTYIELVYQIRHKTQFAGFFFFKEICNHQISRYTFSFFHNYHCCIKVINAKITTNVKCGTKYQKKKLISWCSRDTSMHEDYSSISPCITACNAFFCKLLLVIRQPSSQLLETDYR